MIDVTFQHWKYIFPEEQLIRYGSPHFDRKTAGRVLSTSVVRNAKRVSDHSELFDPKQILCANEAFPEAAVADPLADLDVWNDWRSGIRAFPYPGRYSRLGIQRQGGKTSSTSSVGVLGEIMAGIYAQAGIAPWVLVRVIRRWPDFIFYIGEDRYAFVEAKAYTRELVEQGGLWLQVPDQLLGDCLVDAMQQLNADPYVQVWGAFTYVEQINPLQLQVTFLELDADLNRQQLGTQHILPQAVVSGIAERALRRALLKIPDSNLSLLRKKRRNSNGDEQRQLERSILPVAMEELEEILIDEGVRVAVFASKQEVEKEIRQLLRTATMCEESEGQRFFHAVEQASEGRLSHIRSTGAESLLIADLDRESRIAITNSWKPNWEAANEPYGHIGEVSLWRCGGVVFALGDQSLEGTRIR